MKPVLCNYYLTYRCNARCPFCTIWQEKSVPHSEEAKGREVCYNLSAVKNAGVKIVDFTGGEPLLYGDLPLVLAHAKKCGLKTTVTTNGILYPERAHELTGLIDILQFSLDGATSLIHDAVKGAPCFDRVMESVEMVWSLGERPTFIHTVTNENILSVPEVISLAQGLRVPLFLNPCFTYPGTQGLSRENARNLDKIAQGKGVTIDRGLLQFIIDGGNKRENPRCRAVSAVIVISPDNQLILPCFHYRTMSLPINGKLAEVLASPDRKRARKQQGRYPFCEGCGINCYLRASLYRKLDRYSLLSLRSALKYLWEVYRLSWE